MRKFPMEEGGKKEKEVERRERKEGEKKKERKELRKNGMVYWDRRRQFVKRNDGA